MAPTSPAPTPRSFTPPKDKDQPRRYFSQFRSEPEYKMPLPGGGGGSGSGSHPLSKMGAPRAIKKPKKIIYLMGIFVLLYWFGIRHGLGLERNWRPLGYYVPGRHRRSGLAFDSKYGMATLKESGRGREHPIYELMERGEEKWQRLLASQSKTLGEATAEYEKRYGMPPPLGFDKWWAFCDTHNITIRDDYDHIMKDVLIHHALEPAEWRRRALSMAEEEMTYTMKVSKRDGVSLTGERAEQLRPLSTRDLVAGFLDEMPDGFYTQITVSDHDAGSQVVGHDQRTRAMELLSKGQYFTKAELELLQQSDRNEFFGWFSACAPDSAANSRPGSENTTYSGDAKSFISDHLPTMDYCDFPELKKLHGGMATDYADRSASVIRPIMTLSKFPNDASFLLTPTEGYWNLTESALNHEGFWEEKTDPRVFWRGSSTGGWDVLYRDWRDSHRIRMHKLVNGQKGDKQWKEDEVEVMLPDGKDGWISTSRKAGVLSKAYADVKLSGQAHQCEPELCAEIDREIAFAPRMEPSESLKYRYALDLDGNGWSSRFHRLLSSASPVIKMTMFPEWHQGWLVPWYHYIPLKPDYSDLYDIMAFFVGPVDENGEVDQTLGHDDLARKIGEAGQQFALHQWNWRNMQAYTFRILLEIQRLYASDRRAASFRLPH